ncbi:MAG: TIGR04255 family protein [Pseudomonadota bacterium]
MALEIQNHEVFKRSPIKEAVVNFAVLPTVEFYKLSLIEDIGKSFFDKYPIKKTIKVFRHNFDFDQEGTNSTSSEESIIGYQFWSSDEKELLSCRLDGFSYHKLSPYNNWVDVLDSSIEGWRVYKEVLDIDSISALTVRNINLIEIPKKEFELDEYFLLYPSLTEEFEQKIEHFSNNMIVGFPEFNAKCRVVFNSLPLQENSNSSFVLDIDAFRNIEKTCLSVEQIGNILTGLNKIKDKLFFGSITGNTRELFR